MTTTTVTTITTTRTTTTTLMIMVVTMMMVVITIKQTHRRRRSRREEEEEEEEEGGGGGGGGGRGESRRRKRTRTRRKRIPTVVKLVHKTNWWHDPYCLFANLPYSNHGFRRLNVKETLMVPSLHVRFYWAHCLHEHRSPIDSISWKVAVLFCKGRIPKDQLQMFPSEAVGCIGQCRTVPEVTCERKSWHFGCSFFYIMKEFIISQARTRTLSPLDLWPFCAKMAIVIQ